MSSRVTFKFKHDKQSDSVSFEGPSIKLTDLKFAIITKKSLMRPDGPFIDLEVQDAPTQQTFYDENALIPKNSVVEIKLKRWQRPDRPQWAVANNIIRGGKSGVGQDGDLPAAVTATGDMSEEQLLALRQAATTTEASLIRAGFKGGGKKQVEWRPTGVSAHTVRRLGEEEAAQLAANVSGLGSGTILRDAVTGDAFVMRSNSAEFDKLRMMAGGVAAEASRADHLERLKEEERSAAERRQREEEAAAVAASAPAPATEEAPAPAAAMAPGPALEDEDLCGDLFGQDEYAQAPAPSPAEAPADGPVPASDGSAGEDKASASPSANGEAANDAGAGSGSGADSEDMGDGAVELAKPAASMPVPELGPNATPAEREIAKLQREIQEMEKEGQRLVMEVNSIERQVAAGTMAPDVGEFQKVALRGQYGQLQPPYFLGRRSIRTAT